MSRWLSVRRTPVLIGLFAVLALTFGSWRFGAMGRQTHHVYASEPPVAARIACEPSMTLAIIGDYGRAGQDAADVAALVRAWEPDWVVTTGDNNYPTGAPETIDDNIGQYYSNFIFPYLGRYGDGATTRRFFPALGNHDLDWDSGQPYFDYFTLPGNERTYTVRRWPVQLFILNSDWREPAGTRADSEQAIWLRDRLAASDVPWKLVVLHWPPFTSSLNRDPARHLQWPFAEWGASAVLAGHDHFYERLEADGIPYFVNGAGGGGLYAIGTPEPQSLVRYNDDYGAMRVEAGESCLRFRFITRSGVEIDSLTLTVPPDSGE